MTFVFAIVFFTYGGLILKGRTYVYDYVEGECAKPLGLFGDYDRIHAIADNFACTTACPCNASINITVIHSIATTDWPEDIAAKMVTSPTGNNQITEC